MTIPAQWKTIALDELHPLAERLRDEGCRFVQTHAVNTESGVDLYYTFMRGTALENYRIVGVTPQDAVPSITDLFLAAFVFENEARELFGVDMHDIAIDFGGHMYDVSESAPMTFVSPKQKAEREKARRAAAAKEAKLRRAQAAQAAFDADHPTTAKKSERVFSPETMPARGIAGKNLNESLASAAKTAAKRDAGGYSPEFAMKDEDAEERAALEAKIAKLPPEKAEKVRAAYRAKKAREAAGRKNASQKGAE